MTDKTKEALVHYEAALREAFPSGATGDVFHHWNEARKALVEESSGTEQPAQDKEPCGWRKKYNGEWAYSFTEDAWDFIRRGQRKTWVGLTNEERVEVLFQNPHLTVGGLMAVEAKLKEKND